MMTCNTELESPALGTPGPPGTHTPLRNPHTRLCNCPHVGREMGGEPPDQVLSLFSCGGGQGHWAAGWMMLWGQQELRGKVMGWDEEQRPEGWGGTAPEQVGLRPALCGHAGEQSSSEWDRVPGLGGHPGCSSPQGVPAPGQVRHTGPGPGCRNTARVSGHEVSYGGWQGPPHVATGAALGHSLGQ